MNVNKPVSKVLVLDDCPVHKDALKRFCDENNLVGVKVSKSRLPSVLRSNIDLGAILFGEGYGGSAEASAEIAIRINAVRPELPIIMRRESDPTLDGLPESLRRVVCATYVGHDMAPLRKVIDEYIFSLDYPNALVRGIAEMTQAILGDVFKDLAVACETPYIVRDRIIFGEVFSLIPLESAWCRGYMMMQAEEAPILELLDRFQMTHGARDGEADFRDLNGVLGEVTNLIWGSFRNRYVGDADAWLRSQVQVPLLVNHKHKYISFGSGNPQLCFMYRLTDPQSGRSVKLHQRFVFSLSWSPEDFKEVEEDVGAMVDAGELELF
ncbi:chemotaxis protein CheX [Paraburkholderia lacunae]|uniref:Chemotaxis protein CheX n=1 Tax=Paraburkholderia lacunae TaxID=2211104 RepID=A0A370N935_9BURK|nr:chemotaxis protein CheX [Paraburkholderia lacunae]RDK02065.1 chemotaxis protein CheX [Paraburkholderia lacunae]